MECFAPYFGYLVGGALVLMGALSAFLLTRGG